MAGYDVNETVSLQLNVQNLTDKFYLASLNNGGSRFVLGAAAHRAAERAVHVLSAPAQAMR